MEKNLVQNSKRHSVVQSDRSFMEVVRGEKKQEEVVQIRQALVDGKGKSEAEETEVLPADLKNQNQSQINRIASMGKTGDKPLPTAVGAGGWSRPVEYGNC